MANPNNSIGTNGAFGGRTSVNAFNDIMGMLSMGILSGWSCAPSSGMVVALGGAAGVRDVAIAQDNAGNKTSVNNISGSPINVTIPAAPASNSRVDAIVAYVANPPSSDGVTDNPDACSLVVVSGTTASTPSVPTDSAIRTAITADGASGATAYYAVLAYVTVRTGTTDITSNMISAGPSASIGSNSLASNAVTTAKIADGAVTSDKVDFKTMPSLVGYFCNEILLSYLDHGMTLNGSTGNFTDLDSSQKYLLDYSAFFGIYRLQGNGTTAWSVQYSTDGGNTWTDFAGGGGDTTIRDHGSGVDEAHASAGALICFTGVKQISVRIICNTSNATMAYNRGLATARLFKVPSSFVTNI